MPTDPWGEERAAAQALVDAQRAELVELERAQQVATTARLAADEAHTAELVALAQVAQRLIAAGELEAQAVSDAQAARDDLAAAEDELAAIPPTPEVPAMSWPKEQTVKEALGAYVQGGDYTGAQSALGCTFRYQLRYSPRDTEANARATLVGFAGQGNDQRSNILSYPIATKDMGTSAKARLAKAASGAMDDTWQAFGAAIRAKAKVKGWTMPGGDRPRWIGRAAWESSGDWYPEHSWPGAAPEFRAAFRRMVQQVNCPQVPMVWCLANGKGDWAEAQRAYPGDDVVDGIEFDTYDSWDGYPGASNAVVWDRKVNGYASVQRTSMKRCADFALDHDLFLAVGESNVWDEVQGGKQIGGTDNASWWPNMRRWLDEQKARGIPIGYVNVFLQDYEGGPHHDLRTSRFPKARKAFQDTW